MIIDEARAVTAAWVARHAARDARFRGAFLTGSTIALPAGAQLPATSDVDVTVVVAEPYPPRSGPPSPAGDDPSAAASLSSQQALSPRPRQGKRLFDGVLVDVSYLAESALADPAQVAASFVYAPSFRGGHVLADPTGHLTRLEAAIAPGFASAAATRRRTDDVRTRIRARLAALDLAALDLAASWADLVLGWAFPTSLTAVVALVAALRPPTVRLRYLRARELLAPSAYERLLATLGCAGCDARAVARHLDAVAERFDEAAAILARRGLATTSFPFAADLTPAARPVAIDGSRALVDGGAHREAVFWVVATAARCQSVLSAVAPELARAREPGFRQLVADLTGLRTVGDVRDRRDTLLAAWARVD